MAIVLNNWRSYTNDVYLNGFLFGTINLPNPEDRLIREQILQTKERKRIPRTEITIKNHMDFLEYGPGRYAYPTDIPIVRSFFNSRLIIPDKAGGKF